MVARVVLGVWEKTGQQLLEITHYNRGAALQRLLLVVIVEEGSGRGGGGGGGAEVDAGSWVEEDTSTRNHLTPTRKEKRGMRIVWLFPLW